MKDALAVLGLIVVGLLWFVLVMAGALLPLFIIWYLVTH